MLKLGFAHALLLDLADGKSRPDRRSPRISDSLVLMLAPLDSGQMLLSLMSRLGLLDGPQLERLQQVASNEA